MKKKWYNSNIENGEFDKEEKYYVYEWFNIETGYIFYVGKGCGDRYKTKAKTKRNRYFRAYVEKYQCDVRIIKNNLNEKDAFNLEKDTIFKYRLKGYCSCNFEDGGAEEGSAHLSGELNPMYGKTHTKEAREKIRQANLNGKNAGINNSQFGISPKNRMDADTYNLWLQKHKDNLCFKNGNNIKAKQIDIIKADDDIIYKQFECIKECVIYLQDNFEECKKITFEHLRHIIKSYNSPNNTLCGFYFKIKEPNKDNTVSSVSNNEDVTTIESIS